jgi:methylenetetrahydrofolate dehydrogenase (NADP+)/methenyltetrahydrofolate cyclohydrolase
MRQNRILSANLLDGLALSKRFRAELKVRVDRLREHGIVPRLDVIVAAQDPASLAYVRMKRKWAEAAGILGESYSVTTETTQEELLGWVKELNENPAVHGVLVQHPLPKPLNEDEVLLALGAEKDVDGITPASLGRLVADLPGFRCATPLGITHILKDAEIPVAGRNAVVIGRSVILGKPMALMLLQMNATVTIAHSKTQNLAELCRTADILVAAVGRPEMVKGDWIKPGAVVIDAGYNKVEGRKFDVGDVAFDEAKEVAGWITPVPGGVGPMTVASLLGNCVTAAELRLSRGTV